MHNILISRTQEKFAYNYIIIFQDTEDRNMYILFQLFLLKTLIFPNSNPIRNKINSLNRIISFSIWTIVKLCIVTTCNKLVSS